MRLRGNRSARAEDSVRERARDRLQTVSNLEVMNWSEQALNGLHQSLDIYRTRRDPIALEECRKAVSMLAGAMDVLENRNTP